MRESDKRRKEREKVACRDSIDLTNKISFVDKWMGLGFALSLSLSFFPSLASSLSLALSFSLSLSLAVIDMASSMLADQERERLESQGKVNEDLQLLRKNVQEVWLRIGEGLDKEISQSFVSIS